MQDRVEVWLFPRVTLVGVIVQVSPVEGDTATLIETVPVNPSWLDTVRVDTAPEPASAVATVGFIARAKSSMVYAIVVECDRLPLVPATVTTYVPLDPEQEIAEAPEPETLAGVMLHDSPALGEMLVVSETDAANPCMGATVIVELPATPASVTTADGLAAIVKSWTVRFTVEVWAMLLLVPVRVIT